MASNTPEIAELIGLEQNKVDWRACKIIFAQTTVQQLSFITHLTRKMEWDSYFLNAFCATEIILPRFIILLDINANNLKDNNDEGVN